MVSAHTRWAILWLSLVSLNALLGRGAAQPAGDIVVTVVGLASNAGEVRFGLYATAAAFAYGRGPTVAEGACPVANRQSACRIARVPYGVYALLVGHDVNGDGQVSHNPLSDERKGASNYHQKFWTAPTFDKAKFVHDAEQTVVEIRVH